MKKLFTTILIFTFIALGLPPMDLIQKEFAAGTTWYACTSGGNWSANVWTSVMADQGSCAAALGTPVAGDTAILNSSSGNITVSANAAAAVLTMTGYTGTFALGSSTLTITGGVTLCDTSCTMTATSGILSLTGTQTLTSNGKTWPAKLGFNSNGTITLSGNWINTGLFSNSNTVTLSPTSGETFTANGGYTSNGGLSGTVNLFLGGGTWSGGSILSLSTTLAGNVTIAGSVDFGTGTLLYSSGTITTTGSTLNLQSSSTLNTAGMSWNIVEWPNNITQTLASTLTANTLYAAGANVTFAGNFNMTTQTLQIFGSNSNQVFTLVSGTTVYVTNAISFINANFRSPNVQLNTTTASSPAYLVYTGPVANENTEGMSMTDIFASAPTIPFYGPKILNWNGGTLTRTQGIVNVTAANINRKPINPNTGV